LRPLEGVKELRERRMLSQQELADRAGVSLFTVQRIERGEGSVRPKTGRAIAGALGVGVEDLLGKAPALPLELNAEDEAAARPDTDVVYETVYSPDDLEDAISRTFEEVQKALRDVDTKGRRLSIRHRDDGSVEVRVEPMSPRSSRVRSSSGKTVKVRRGRETA
jgi:transcriptional regulator with XRE-family HTH domain